MFSTYFIFRQQENLVDNQKKSGWIQATMQQNTIPDVILEWSLTNNDTKFFFSLKKWGAREVPRRMNAPWSMRPFLKV